MTRHILLVENGQAEKKVFANALQRLDTDFFLMYAREPQTALKMLSQFKPDIVFIGSDLPGKSLRLLKQILLLKDCSHLPVYIYTKVLDGTVGMRALLSGASGCLLKTESEEFLTNSLFEIIKAES